VVEELLFAKPGFLVNPDLIPKGGILNINIPGLPREKIKGVRFTAWECAGITPSFMSAGTHGEHLTTGWGVPQAPWNPMNWTLTWWQWIKVTFPITPLKLDLTNYEELDRLRNRS